ncbi:MAG: putative Thermostable beta-glucosidase B [Streblomastix strix]|uniref:beta-glucosidase n=1 Tax=Streblomastix strix TaxID=222440 RepID=A0A5J4UY80_9EUKA|nr:MAG: putative Thermostable beta-glucosidase B [Streblomastix strix]
MEQLQHMDKLAQEKHTHLEQQTIEYLLHLLKDQGVDNFVANGVGMILGPGINIKRDPRNGRNFEYLSEDPFLSGELGSSFVLGVQSCGVASCVKHFAVNNQEMIIDLFIRDMKDQLLDQIQKCLQLGK